MNFFAIARHEIAEPMILLLLFVGVVYAVLGKEISDAVTSFVVILFLAVRETAMHVRLPDRSSLFQITL